MKVSDTFVSTAFQPQTLIASNPHMSSVELVDNKLKSELRFVL